MIAQPFWINSQLAIIPRPRGGDWLDDEMLALRASGIDVLVSMIEHSEANELGLGREEASSTQAGMHFVHFPIPDRETPPDLKTFESFLANLEANMANGKRIGIHCRGCIGRASVVAASLMARAGITHGQVWRQIAAARGCEVPDTREQREWVNRHMGPKP